VSVRVAGGLLAAALLSAVAALHVAWASGSPWPLADRDQLNRHVFPAPRPVARGTADAAAARAAPARAPSRGATWTVALLCAAAALLLVLRSFGLGGRPVQAGALGVAAVLGLRGLAGLLLSGLLALGGPLFTHWDLRVYSPLCLLIAALSLWVGL
jgi:hypothetical protein